MDKISDLLMRCLSAKAGGDTRAVLAGLTPEEWKELARLSRAQQVSGLLYKRLGTRDLLGFVPEKVRLRLRQRYQRTVAHNLGTVSDLGEVAARLQSRQIPVIVLKGVHLAGLLYRDLGLREMVDLDLLVPPAALEKTVAELRAIGYEPVNSFNLQADTAENQHLPRLIKPGRIAIEIHWTIAPPKFPWRLGPEELWRRAVAVRIAQADVLTLSAEDLLLHLCCHASYKHLFWMGLRPLCDIAQITDFSGEQLDWAEILERALRWQCGSGVYLSLRLARELMGASVPDDVFSGLRPATDPEVAFSAAREQIFADLQLGNTLPLVLLKSTAAHGPGGKLRVIRRLFRRDRSRRLRAPFKTAILQYYLYWCRLLLRSGKTALRLRRGEPEVLAAARRENLLKELLLPGPKPE